MHQIKVILSEIHYGKEPSGKIDFVLIYSFVSFVLLTRIFLSTSYPTPFVFLSQRMYRVASKCPVYQHHRKSKWYFFCSVETRKPCVRFNLESFWPGFVRWFLWKRRFAKILRPEKRLLLGTSSGWKRLLVHESINN